MDWEKEISKLEGLAKIDLEKEEAVKISKQLSEIEDNFKMMAEVETEGVSKDWKFEEMENIWREDKPRRKGIEPKVLIDEAPKKRNRFIEVTGVFK